MISVITEMITETDTNSELFCSLGDLHLSS